MPQDDTSSKLDVYNLGEKGVNLTKSPIHLEDGELTSAQNAEFYLDEGLGALRKRPGLTRLNSGNSLAGAVRGIIGVPLPGPGKRSVYAQRPGTPWFRVTTDGTTWADTTNEFPTTPGGASSPYHTDFPMSLSRNVARQFFWSTVDGVTSVILAGFDGIAQYEVMRFDGGSLRVLAAHNGELVITVNTDASRVFVVDLLSGDIEQVGADFSGGPAGEEVYCGASYQGKIWVGTVQGAAGPGKLYSARKGDTAWVTERTSAANHHAYASLCAFKGKLYAGTVAVAGTAAIVEERTAGGTWALSRTGSVSAEVNAYHGLSVCNAEMYAAYSNPIGGSAVFCAIEKFTGSAWSVDKNLQLDSVLGVFGVVVAGRTIFYNTFTATAAKVYRKIPAGAFASVDTTVGTVTTGVMGVL